MLFKALNWAHYFHYLIENITRTCPMETRSYYILLPQGSGQKFLGETTRNLPFEGHNSCRSQVYLEKFALANEKNRHLFQAQKNTNDSRPGGESTTVGQKRFFLPQMYTYKVKNELTNWSIACWASCSNAFVLFRSCLYLLVALRSICSRVLRSSSSFWSDSLFAFTAWDTSWCSSSSWASSCLICG